MASGEEKVLLFDREKETKNSVRFQERGQVPWVGPLYMQKHALQAMGGDINTPTIRVTVRLPTADEMKG